jgi:hypothetical protein
VGGSAECSNALEDLGRILLLVQVDGEEGIMLVEVQGRRLAGAEEEGDVFHLHKGHCRSLEPEARRWESEVG